MKTSAEALLPEVLAAYDFGGQVAGALRYGSGHINDTFAVYTQKEDGAAERFILQRINTGVFKRPDQLMENICGVTEHLLGGIAQRGGDVRREAMRVLNTREGSPFFTDSEGGAWRVYIFVEDTVCLQQSDGLESFEEAAVSFGNFQRLLADYPAATLHETIDKFHDTRDRYLRFERALAADTEGRAAEVAAEVAFVKERRADCAVLMDLLDAGELPLRVTHNDTKLNNILLDAHTRKGLCIIDLDTVMPGLALHDYGDSIRFGANDCVEDEPDLGRVNFSIPLFEAYTRGFLSSVGAALTEVEKAHLPWGARLMTLECGIRFLTDYLEGDVYFRIHRPDQNLDRCRTQFKLVRDMEEHWDELNTIVQFHCQTIPLH